MVIRSPLLNTSTGDFTGLRFHCIKSSLRNNSDSITNVHNHMRPPPRHIQQITSPLNAIMAIIPNFVMAFLHRIQVPNPIRARKLDGIINITCHSLKFGNVVGYPFRIIENPSFSPKYDNVPSSIVAMESQPLLITSNGECQMILPHFSRRNARLFHSVGIILVHSGRHRIWLTILEKAVGHV